MKYCVRRRYDSQGEALAYKTASLPAYLGYIHNNNNNNTNNDNKHNTTTTTTNNNNDSNTHNSNT